MKTRFFAILGFIVGSLSLMLSSSAEAQEKRLCGLGKAMSVEEKIADCNEQLRSPQGYTFTLVYRGKFLRSITTYADGRPAEYPEYDGGYQEVYRDDATGIIWGAGGSGRGALLDSFSEARSDKEVAVRSALKLRSFASTTGGRRAGLLRSTGRFPASSTGGNSFGAGLRT